MKGHLVKKQIRDKNNKLTHVWINPNKGSEAFGKRSKIKRGGSLITLYHGQPAFWYEVKDKKSVQHETKEIKKFHDKEQRFGGNTGGIFFTESKDIALEYANEKEGGGRLYSVHLDMRKPFVYETNKYTKYLPMGVSGIKKEQIEKLIEMGYDGVIQYKRVLNKDKVMNVIDQAVAFSGDQVRINNVKTV